MITKKKAIDDAKKIIKTMNNSFRKERNPLILTCSSCKQSYEVRSIADLYVCPLCGELDRSE